MSGWSLDNDRHRDSATRSDVLPSKRENSAASGGSFQVRKAHAFFAAEDDAAFQPDPVPSSSRRKQSSERTRELVLDDAEDDGDEDGGSRSATDARSAKPIPAVSVDAKQLYPPTSSSNAKADESAIPDVIHSRLRSKISQSPTSSSASSNKKRVSLSEDPALGAEALMFYLVREFLSLHVADSAVASLFEKERENVKALDEKSAKKMFQHVVGQNNAASKGKEEPSLLEQLVIVWDESTHKRRCERPVSASSSSSSSSTSRRSSSSRSSETTATTTSTDAKKKSSSSSSARKKKPALNVITAAEELDDLDDNHNEAASEGAFNRLNHPGSTPKPQLLSSSAAASILGDPGSTPKARAGELTALGFDEDELRTPVPVENIGSSADSDARDDDSGLSDYAKRKRIAKKHNKRVSLGVPGSTPTKEYIFFRETPPSYVTESVEAAVEVLEKLGLDPAFRLQAAAPQERFIELQSSEVSKYSVGQEVRSLGAQRNVSGVVSKIFGSRQCGTSGPGTIVIDTCPEETSDSASAATTLLMPVGTRPATPTAPSSFRPDEEDLMDALVAQ